MTESHLSTSVDGRTDVEIRAAVHAVIMELAPVHDGAAGDGAAGDGARLVDDLGYHSLALLELAFTLEDEFNLTPIDEETARSIVTISDVQDHVLRELRARSVD